MAAADGDFDMSQKRPRPCCQHGATAPLPTDLVLDIAVRSDPATLIRCAATCKDLRRHIAHPSFRGRLRLRHSRRFVPSLLRGHLLGKWDKHLYLDDTTAAADGDGSEKRVIAAGCFGRDQEQCRPVAARDGLVLIRVINLQLGGDENEMRVCCPATGRCQSLPPVPTFQGQYVLLVGDGEGGVAGRPFRVLKATSVLKKRGRRRCLQIQTFSSERGTWGPRTRIPTPFTTSCSSLAPPAKHLVVGDAVHWLCRNENSYYVFKLDVGDGGDDARLTMTKLPPSLHRQCDHPRAKTEQILLATASAAGAPVVLVASQGKISAWKLSEHTGRWTDRPYMVVHKEAIVQGFIGADVQERLGSVLQLEWFAERSGFVLVWIPRCGFCCLDLQSKKVVRRFSCSACNSILKCPYEIDLSSWVPTFSKSFI